MIELNSEYYPIPMIDGWSMKMAQHGHLKRFFQRIAQTDQTSRNETQVRIFPNPVKETLYIEVLNDLESYVATVQIFNTLGQLIFNDQLSHKMESIDLSSLQIGLYIYTIQYETGHSEKGKFVINR